MARSHNKIGLSSTKIAFNIGFEALEEESADKESKIVISDADYNKPQHSVSPYEDVEQNTITRRAVSK